MPAFSWSQSGGHHPRRQEGVALTLTDEASKQPGGAPSMDGGWEDAYRSWTDESARNRVVGVVDATERGSRRTHSRTSTIAHAIPQHRNLPARKTGELPGNAAKQLVYDPLQFQSHRALGDQRPSAMQRAEARYLDKAR